MDITKERAFEYLKQWQKENASLGLYFGVPEAVVGLIMLAQVSEVSIRIVLTNESSVFRFSLENARFQFGPLHVLCLPSTRGPAIALTSLPNGLLATDGLHIRLESGFVLFLCELKSAEQRWLNSVAGSMGELGPGGFLDV